MRRTDRDSLEEVMYRGREARFNVASVLTNPKAQWRKLSQGNIRVARTIDIDWDLFNPQDFLFTHDTIVASVATERNGYHIKPACSGYVNINGNAWTNEVLLATFRSFIGGYNFADHLQVPSLSKGFILDATLRPHRVYGKAGKWEDVFVCDILVATSRKHDLLCSRILKGELRTLSMGTICAFVTCSCCGGVFGDGEDACEHIENQLGETFKDENGVERVVSELCGRMFWEEKEQKWVGDPMSNKFIEASWVDDPAFPGAVVNHILVPDNSFLRYGPSFKKNLELEGALDNLVGMRVADRMGRLSVGLGRSCVEEVRHLDMISKVVCGK